MEIISGRQIRHRMPASSHELAQIDVKRTMQFKPSKGSAPPASTLSKSSLCIYAFRMILTMNSDYFLK
jgi:hypothetical protein